MTSSRDLIAPFIEASIEFVDNLNKVLSAAMTEPRITVQISPYHTWQGRPEDAPKMKEASK